MKIIVLGVGRAKGPLAGAIEEYEERVRRYFSFESVEVKEIPVRRGANPEEVVTDEGERLLARVPGGSEVVALDRRGEGWSSEALAAFLSEAALRATPGITFVIGGAFGLAPAVLERARHALSLSDFTLPHDMARLVLAEQIYRAGTIQRGEPYHKANRL